MYQLIVVEDESKIRDGIIHLFPWESAGFQVVGDFADGQQALEYVLSNPVDVVLTDIRMPRMDGLTLAHRLEECGREIPVVFLSGYQDFNYLQEAIRVGVKDYLVKPILHDQLLTCFERIRERLDRRGSAESKGESPSYHQQLIRVVQEYIRNNVRDATLEDAAVLVNLSPNYLSRIYKERTGHSFTDYLVETRMQKAAEFLRGIEYRHYEIAYMVGYENPKNFSRAFKQYYKVTPKEYRERETNGEIPD